MNGPPGEIDLHLFNEGTHRRIHDFLGAHANDTGCSFAVWAPNARAVDVVGDFTGWKEPVPLEPIATSGVWSGHVDGAEIGHGYRFGITGSDRRREERADPVAAATFESPSTASRIVDLTYDWRDAAWMRGRAPTIAADAPISIYEVHLGSWGRLATKGRRWPRVRRARRSARRPRPEPRFHPRRAASRDGASVLRIVGLPGHGVLRADRSIRTIRST